MAVTLISFAFFFGIAISRVGLPPMVGFLVAGFAYNFMGFQAPDSLQAVADLGVTLLLFSIGLNCKVVAIAKHETEVEELNKMGVPSFNLYLEAGEGLGREALGVLTQKSKVI